MSVTIDDLRPKTFTITVQGVALQCKPLRLSHALIVSKIGDIFQNSKNFTSAEIKEAEKDMDTVISELIPELVGIELDINSLVEVITQMTNNSEPADNKILKDSGVKLDTDPKVQGIG